MDRTRHDRNTRHLETMPNQGAGHGADTRMNGQRAGSTDDVTLRFGPGVPSRLTDTWREGNRRGSRRQRPLLRRIISGLVTLGVAVLTGLIVWFLLRGGPTAEVTGVTVSAPAGVQGCGTTATITGVIHTNGGQGEVSYRWKRSDGQNSGVLTDTVPKGKHSIQVPLRWTVKGQGTLHAVATLEVVSPKGPDGTASAGFDYQCR